MSESYYERERRKNFESRRRIANLGEELWGSMLAALGDPKNVAKGDGWREMAWTELEDLLAEECRELREEAMLGDYEAAMREAGDCLAVIAFFLDKADSERKGEHERRAQ
ncbi:MAG: hypothetical protein M3R38_21470 [Actinomycetota bacterium]|nr:hypothetical protein [Actinomycetota bacterium]